MVYNNECVELFSFLVEEYNTSTLFIFQDNESTDFSLEIWYNIFRTNIKEYLWIKNYMI